MLQFALRPVVTGLTALSAVVAIGGVTAVTGSAAALGAASGRAGAATISPGTFPTAYVANESGSSVQPIDTATDKAGAPIKLSSFDDYWGLGIAPAGATAYVADYGGGGSALYPISLATRKAGPAITVGGNPGEVAFAPDGTTAYVPITPEALAPFDGYLVPVDLATRTAGPRIPVGLSPFGIAITPNGQTAYVVNAGSNSVTPVNLATDTPGTPIPVGTDPFEIAITPSGTMAYVTNSGGPSITPHGTVTPINLVTGKAEKPIAVYGGYPVGIAITANGATAYVVSNFASTVTPISLATRKTGKPIKVGRGAFGIAISPEGGTAYVAGSVASTVTPIDLASGRAERAIKVGKSPVAVAFAPGWYARSASPARTRRSPALAVYRGALYTAFSAAAGTIGYAERRGSRWSAIRTVRGRWGTATSSQPPALEVHAGRLYAFWTARTGGRIRYSAFNGSSWSTPGTVAGSWGRADSATGPSATTAGSASYVAWTTKSGSVAYSSSAGSSWTKQAVVASGVTRDAPALTAAADGPNTPPASATVVFAWTSKAGRIGYGQLTSLGFRALGTVAGPVTGAAPALGYAGTRADGTLYLAWRASVTGKVGYRAIFGVADSSLTPADWTPAEYQPAASTAVGPAITANGFTVYLGWSQRGPDQVDVSSALNPY